MWPNLQLFTSDLLSKESSIVWCHYDYLTAPDRDGASPNLNHKYPTLYIIQKCLIFTTLDWAASDMILTLANESKQVSPTRCCVLLKLKLGSHKHAMKAENIIHILFHTFFFTVKQNACQESQLTTLIFLYLFFFSSHVWSRECPWLHVSLWNRSYNRQVSGLTVWSNRSVCVHSIIRLKIGWMVFMSVVSLENRLVCSQL